MENRTAQTSYYARFGKPTLDRFLGLALGIVTLPALLTLVAVSWAAFGWAPLVRQTRLGRGRTTFSLLRINTSNRNGTDLRGRRLRLSSFLRRSSLDELPQVWNVVLGHMSLVGPRPLDPIRHHDVDDLGMRNVVRPGLTGPWQVEARGDGRRLMDHQQIDVGYAQHVNLRTDLWVLIRTIPALIRRREVA